MSDVRYPELMAVPVLFKSLKVCGMSATDLDGYSDYNGTGAVFWEYKHKNYFTDDEDDEGQIEAFVNNINALSLDGHLVLAIHDDEEKIAAGNAVIYLMYNRTLGWHNTSKCRTTKDFHTKMLLKHKMICVHSDGGCIAIPRRMR